MKKMKSSRINIAITSCTLMLASCGCFTVHESTFPVSHMSSASDGREVRVALAGFEATVTSYMPIRTYSTVWREEPGWYHHGRYRRPGAFPVTESSTTYIPQVHEDTSFVKRAADILEENGFILASTNADYIIDVTFSGPFITGNDRFVECIWIISSLLSADYSAQTWKAKLKIRDAKTGRLAYAQEFTHRYSVAVWGPLPILSPLGAEETTSQAMQSRSLSALTELAMEDATKFLASSAQ